MPIHEEKVDRNIELLFNYLTDATVTDIARRHHLSHTTVKRIVDKLLAKLWVFLKRNKVLHPYGPKYEHAYRTTNSGVEFRPRNLVKADIVAHKEFWIEQIVKYKESLKESNKV